MTKPNAVEEMIRGTIVCCVDRDGGVDDDAGRQVVAILDAAGLAIVPHDWNHREEDWSLQSVSEWLER